MITDPTERDLIIRTVIGEAASEGPVGQLAVAHVIANRMRSAGRGARDIIMARHQFEPWSNPNTAARLQSIQPTDPAYQRVERALEPFFSGQSQDPTGGATHFYSPTAQAGLGRQAPSWDNGSGQDIGRHRFFALGYAPSSSNNSHGIPFPGAPAAGGMTGPRGGLWDQAGALTASIQWDDTPDPEPPPAAPVAPAAVASVPAAPAAPGTPPTREQVVDDMWRNRPQFDYSQNPPRRIDTPAAPTAPAAAPTAPAPAIQWDDAPATPAPAAEVPEITVRPPAQAPMPQADIAGSFEAVAGARPGGSDADRQRLSEGVRRTADQRLLDSEGITPGQAQRLTFTGNAVNTALFNIPRNIVAGGRALQSGRTFTDEYQRTKDIEAAAARQNPFTSMAGTATGIGGAIAALPVAGAGATATAPASGALGAVGNFFSRQAPTAAGRMGQAAVTGAGYSAAAEAADSKSIPNTLAAGALGVGLGAVGQRAGEAIVNRILRPRALDTSGDLAQGFMARARQVGMTDDEVSNIVSGLRRAGIDDAQIGNRLFAEVERRAGGQGASPELANELAAGQLGIPLSRGQATQNMAAQQTEQTALRSGANPRANETATQFFNRQNEAAQAARGQVGARLGGDVADTPLDAAAMAAQGIRSRAVDAKARATGLYDEAFSAPGDFAPEAVRGIGTRIQQGLTSRADPIIIDDVTTPIATRAMRELDNISNLRIQNVADPAGQPAASEIVGVNMRGIDQARRRIQAYYRAAAPGSADRRAMQAVIGEFDGQIEQAMSRGLFSGDDRALDALREARSAYRSYQTTFKPQGAGDDVGQAMRRIIERDAQPQEVANLLYGQAKIGERGVSVRLAERLEGVLGKDSPEWAAIRQGLWQRLTSKPEGVTDFGPQAQGQRIAQFINGDGRALAQKLFSPDELRQMREYANVMGLIAPMRGAVNTSGTAYIAPMVQRIQEKYLPGIMASIGTAAGFATGGAFGAATGGAAGRQLGQSMSSGREARRIGDLLSNRYPQYRPNFVSPGVPGAVAGATGEDIYGQ
jgi:hypothetical protein